jgi:hypothetical protein
MIGQSVIFFCLLEKNVNFLVPEGLPRFSSEVLGAET